MLTVIGVSFYQKTHRVCNLVDVIGDAVFICHLSNMCTLRVPSNQDRLTGVSLEHTKINGVKKKMEVQD